MNNISDTIMNNISDIVIDNNAFDNNYKFMLYKGRLSNINYNYFIEKIDVLLLLRNHLKLPNEIIYNIIYEILNVYYFIDIFKYIFTKRKFKEKAIISVYDCYHIDFHQHVRFRNYNNFEEYVGCIVSSKHIYKYVENIYIIMKILRIRDNINRSTLCHRKNLDNYQSSFECETDRIIHDHVKYVQSSSTNDFSLDPVSIDQIADSIDEFVDMLNECNFFYNNCLEITKRIEKIFSNISDILKRKYPYLDIFYYRKLVLIPYYSKKVYADYNNIDGYMYSLYTGLNFDDNEKFKILKMCI